MKKPRLARGALALALLWKTTFQGDGPSGLFGLRVVSLAPGFGEGAMETGAFPSILLEGLFFEGSALVRHRHRLPPVHAGFLLWFPECIWKAVGPGVIIDDRNG